MDLQIRAASANRPFCKSVIACWSFRATIDTAPPQPVIQRAWVDVVLHTDLAVRLRLLSANRS
jgi:hypothetical protein